MSKLSEKFKKYKNYIRNSVMYFPYYHLSIRKNIILAVVCCSVFVHCCYGVGRYRAKAVGENHL